MPPDESSPHAPVQIDHLALPHVFEAILAASSLPSLLAFRATARAVHDQVDDLLVTPHIAIASDGHTLAVRDDGTPAARIPKQDWTTTPALVQRVTTLSVHNPATTTSRVSTCGDDGFDDGDAGCERAMHDVAALKRLLRSLHPSVVRFVNYECADMVTLEALRIFPHAVAQVDMLPETPMQASPPEAYLPPLHAREVTLNLGWDPVYANLAKFSRLNVRFAPSVRALNVLFTPRPGAAPQPDPRKGRPAWRGGGGLLIDQVCWLVASFLARSNANNLPRVTLVDVEAWDPTWYVNGSMASPPFVTRPRVFKLSTTIQTELTRNYGLTPAEAATRTRTIEFPRLDEYVGSVGKEFHDLVRG
ncbi:uncharacterized protein LOC62_07G009782 [Vanrija pseudolonga]|uniref:Uncharacterized protein n=1 Tax=Vanrija pseudolonga TaxID=143232 RepID=A0AAF0YG59_9TREE|nr:hypothetical protein LOC62_07G009782 [Vanrija pseudolonga]